MSRKQSERIEALTAGDGSRRRGGREGGEIVFAIDPGPEFSQLVEVDFESGFGMRIASSQHLPNADARRRLENVTAMRPVYYRLVIEQVESFGMAVGREVFETVRHAGRFEELWESRGGRVYLVPRREVKLHLCGSMRAKDANIRQALVDRFGAPGNKKAPGQLYGVSGHGWSALALAVTYHDLYGAQVTPSTQPALFRAGENPT